LVRRNVIDKKPVGVLQRRRKSHSVANQQNETIERTGRIIFIMRQQFVDEFALTEQDSKDGLVVVLDAGSPKFVEEGVVDVVVWVHEEPFH